MAMASKRVDDRMISDEAAGLYGSILNESMSGIAQQAVRTEEYKKKEGTSDAAYLILHFLLRHGDTIRGTHTH